MSLNWYRRNRRSVFFRAVVVLLLVTAPLYAMGLYLNERGAMSVRQEISRSMEADVSAFTDSVDNEISRVASLLQQYVADPDILRLSTSVSILNDYEKTVTIDEVYLKLDLLKNASDYIKNVNVHFSQLDRTISTNGYYQAIPKTRFRSLAGLRSNPNDTIFSWDNGLYLVVRYPDRVYEGNEKPLFILEIELDRSRLRRALQRFEAAPGTGAGIFHAEWTIESVNSASGGAVIEQIVTPFRESHVAGADRASDKQAGVVPFGRETEGYLGAYQYSQVLNALVVYYAPETIALGPLRTYRISFWGLFALAFFVIVGFSYWIYSSIHSPLNKLIRMFRKLENGEFDVPITHSANDEFQYLFTHFNRTVSRLKILLDERFENETRVQRAELKYLQSQIHPHFLYNNFYNVYRMARAGDLDNIIKVSRNLGDYFRFITRNTGDETSLAQELSHAANYLEIQSFRFSNRIRFLTNIPTELPSIQVPKLIVQPLLENALHHGLEDVVQDGELRFEMRSDERMIEIIVEDNGKGMPLPELERLQNKLEHSSEIDDSTGLLNVHRRLRLKFGAGAGLSVRSGETGFVVALRIPLGEDVPCIDS